MKLIDESDKDCIFTVQEFTEGVNAGGFTDYDGIGYFATETHRSNILVECSIPFYNPDKSLYTHVVWYNK